MRGSVPGGMILWVLAAAMLQPARAVEGQVDNRVNRGTALGRGHALDRNPGLGTRGLNSRFTGFDSGRRSNAIVSGNVTGLARFQGPLAVPYGNQFRDSLPTAGLSAFRSQSVGLKGIQVNRVPAPGFYFGVQETVPDLGYIRRGLNAPGSSMLRSPYTPPLRASTPRSSARSLRLPDPADRRLGMIREPAGHKVYQREVDVGASADALGGGSSAFRSAAGSSIFGAPGPMPRMLVDPLRPDLRRGGTGSSPFARTDGRLLPERLSPIRPDLWAGGGPMRPGVAGLLGQVSGSEAPSWELGGDRFEDMYKAVQAAERLGLAQFGFKLGAGAGRALGDPLDGEMPAPGGPALLDLRAVRRQSDTAIAELASVSRWASELLDDPVTSFAGRYQSRFNELMLAAESAMAAGEYYRAARQCDQAHTLDPRHPLPLLGRGHALIAAGDYVTASLLLQKGIERFPQIAVFRLDLVELAGRQDAFDLRRADLEERLSRSEDFELRFLLGYLELYSGLPEEGVRNLKRAAKLAPEGSIISLFPDLVLGRQTLPTSKAGQMGERPGV